MAILPPSDFRVDRCENNLEFIEMADNCKVEEVDLDKIKQFLKNNENWIASRQYDVQDSIANLRNRINAVYEDPATLESIDNIFKEVTAREREQTERKLEGIRRIMERESIDETETKKIP